MNYIKLVCLCWAYLLCCACNAVEESQETDGYVTVSFAMREVLNHQSRSSISVDESMVNDVVLLAYSGGVLIAESVVCQSEDIVLRLEKGRAYNFYAIANVEEFRPPVSEIDLYDLSFSVNLIDGDSRSFPMAWSLREHAVDGDDQIAICFERLVAKILLSVDNQVEGLEIVAAGLKQVPLLVSPFASEGSRAKSGKVVDGDYAVDVDLACLNDGGSICFYMPENMHGDLLVGNDDPMKKVLDENSEESKLCTYVEVLCRFVEGSAKEGEVLYRMYLGEDNVKNFDVKRNKVLHVTLTLTESGISVKDSWKIDASSVQDVVKPQLAPLEVSLNATDVLLNVGETFTLRYMVRYNDGTSTGFVSYGFAPLNGCSPEGWVIDDNRIAEISSLGVITPKSPGRTTVSITVGWWQDDKYCSLTAKANVTVLAEPVDVVMRYVYAIGPAMFYDGSGGPTLIAVYSDGTELPVVADWWETSDESVYYDESLGIAISDPDGLVEGETICKFTGSYCGFVSSLDMLYGKWVKDIGYERVGTSKNGVCRYRVYLIFDDFSKIYVPFAYRLSLDGNSWGKTYTSSVDGIEADYTGYYIDFKTVDEYYDYTGYSRIWNFLSRCQ